MINGPDIDPPPEGWGRYHGITPGVVAELKRKFTLPVSGPSHLVQIHENGAIKKTREDLEIPMAVTLWLLRRYAEYDLKKRDGLPSIPLPAGCEWIRRRHDDGSCPAKFLFAIAFKHPGESQEFSMDLDFVEGRACVIIHPYPNLIHGVTMWVRDLARLLLQAHDVPMNQQENSVIRASGSASLPRDD